MKFEIRPFENIFSSEFNASPLALEVLSSYHFSLLSFAYENEYSQNKFQNLSFSVFYQNQPVAAFGITAREEELSFFGRPLLFFILKGLKEELFSELKIPVFQKLDELIKIHNIKKMSFFSDPMLNDYYFDQIKGHDMWLCSIVDLRASENTILRNIRKSYRSLINWGEREIKIVQIDDKNPDALLFEKFRQFHIEVAGKETRTKQSWDLQFEMIKSGKAFLNLGFLQNNSEEQLVSGTLVLLGRDEAYYGVAVNDRKIMSLNKPLGHSTIYRSILLAKSLGLKKFNLGPIYFSGMNEKEKHIGVFKKGFSSHIEGSLIMKIEL